MNEAKRKKNIYFYEGQYYKWLLHDVFFHV
jgi:hypothetical protein